jgi:hypothetical protein
MMENSSASFGLKGATSATVLPFCTGMICHWLTRSV